MASLESQGKKIETGTGKTAALQSAMKEGGPKKTSFENTRCQHGVTNANYCASCAHPKRAKANEGRIPFRDRMSTRKD